LYINVYLKPGRNESSIHDQLCGSGCFILLTGLLIVFYLDFLGSGLELAGEVFRGSEKIDLNNVWKVSALLFRHSLAGKTFSFSLGEIKEPEKNVPLLYWLVLHW
jgi:APA family basic amino acid/polyamine antiporter